MAEKKGSGGSPIHFLCSRIYNFWGSLISGDEQQRLVNWLSVSITVVSMMDIWEVRLYLGCFGWVINLIYSILFSNILHAFKHNMTYAQNRVCPIAMRYSRAVI